MVLVLNWWNSVMHTIPPKQIERNSDPDPYYLTTTPPIYGAPPTYMAPRPEGSRNFFGTFVFCVAHHRSPPPTTCGALGGPEDLRWGHIRGEWYLILSTRKIGIFPLNFCTIFWKFLIFLMFKSKRPWVDENPVYFFEKNIVLNFIKNRSFFN